VLLVTEKSDAALKMAEKLGLAAIPKMKAAINIILDFLIRDI
jgi:hypothetical protein